MVDPAGMACHWKNRNRFHVTRAQHALPADTVALRGAGEVQAVLWTLRARKMRFVKGRTIELLLCIKTLKARMRKTDELHDQSSHRTDQSDCY